MHRTNESLNTINFTDDDILSVIKKLNPTKAHGHDQISISMLRSDQISISIWYLFINEMINRMSKMINLFHFFQFSEEYLNVSYTIKCTHFFVENGFISPNQSGFKRGSSYINHLLSITQDIYQSLDQGYEVYGVFLDISKAFEKVWRKGLVYKLEQNGIGAPLLKIVTDFLKSRKRRVNLNCQHSSWSEVLASVLQRPILCLPFVFYLYGLSVIQNCL